MRKSSSPHSWQENQELLRSVSRSFFVSIKCLPSEMREPVALGYLLARLTDTIADSGDIPGARRTDTLQTLANQIERDDDTSPLSVDQYTTSINHSGEQQLLKAAPTLFDWLNQIEGENRRSIKQVLQTIIRGQIWDLNQFSDHSQVISREELLTYTYLVAGCVGEFWTEIGFQNLGDRFADPKKREMMMKTGKHLGQGLQLINVIRDLHEDIPNGRFYLDESDFAFWLEQCRAFLDDGRHYLSAVKNVRVRFATALPLHLAEETANAIEKAGLERVKREKIKVRRSTLWKSALKAGLLS